MLVGGDPQRAYPLVRVHDAGLFSGVIAEHPGDYRLAGALRRRRPHRGRPVPLAAHARRDRPAPDRRGPPRAAVGGARRARPHATTPRRAVSGTSFAVWAPTRPGRARHRRLRRLGRLDPSRCARWAAPGCGSSSCPASGVGTRYKFRDPRPRTACGGRRPTRWRSPTEVPPATASVVTALHHEWGDDDVADQRARSDPARRADERLRGPPRLVAAGPELPGWPTSSSTTWPRPASRTSSCCPWPSTRSAARGATRSPPTTRRPPGSAPPTTSATSSTPCTRPASASSSTGCPRTSRRTTGRWPASTAPRSTSTPTRAAASTPTGARYVFDFGRREVRNFLVANALYWLEEFHVDGLRVDAVASMLYLDYSRNEGEWLPNVYGGRENLDAVAFLQEMNATVYRHHPGVMTIAEESTAWPGVTRPTHLGGLGLRVQVEHGLDARHAQLHRQGPDLPRLPPQPDDVLAVYAFSENFVLPLSHDEVVHGKGSLWERMPGDAWNKAAGPARPAGLHVGAPRQAAAVHGRGVRPGAGVVRGAARWTGTCSANPLHGGVKRLVARPQPRLHGRPGAVDARTPRPRASPGSTPTTPSGNVLSFLRHGVDADGNPTVLACVANFSGGPHEDYRVGLPFAGRWREVLNTDAEIYGGSGVGNLGVVEAEPQVARPPRVRGAAAAALRGAVAGPRAGRRRQVGRNRRPTSGRRHRWPRSLRRWSATRRRRRRPLRQPADRRDRVLQWRRDEQGRHPARGRRGRSGSSGFSAVGRSVSDDAPIVAPAVPEIDVPPPGTGAGRGPGGNAYADPPVLRAHPGRDRSPRRTSHGSRATPGSEAVTMGGEPDATRARRPSATRPAAGSDGDPRADDSSTHQ